MKYRISETDLRKMYQNDLMDVNAIAAHFGCSAANIRRLLKKHGIRRGKAFIASGTSPVWNRGKTKDDDDRLMKISNLHRGSGNPMNGRKSWNSGKTKDDDARLKIVSDKLSGMSKSSEHRKKLSKAKQGLFAEKANNWQGGRSYQNRHLYLMNRFTRDGQRWYEHRWVAWKFIIAERDFLEGEEVHHIDQDRENNEPGNLIVLMAKDHRALHQAIKGGVVRKEDQIAWLVCNSIEFEVHNGKDQNLYAA